MPWTSTAQGEDIPLTPGKTYAVVASVSDSTTGAKIDAVLAKYFPGLTIVSYFEQGESGGPPVDPDSDRKQVAAVVVDKTFTGSLSWSKSIPIVAPDIYTLSGAWVWSGEGSPEAASAPWEGAIPVRRPSNSMGWVAVGLVGLAFGGLAAYHWRKPIRKAIAHAAAS